MMQNPYEVTKEDKVQPENLPPAEISLTDCLACSGCVTSAEAVLISMQSHAEVLNTLDAHPEVSFGRNQNGISQGSGGTSDDEGRIFVASVSPQVRASLAATYNITEQEATHIIDQLLRGPQGLRSGGKHGSGFTWVIDSNTLREAVLVLTADEVGESLSSSNTSGAPVPKKPVLSSACPGWICYAEKTHPFILPHLSRLKSPQALSGTFLKTALSKALNVPASRIWHLAVMPCFDKKLEASREELTDASWHAADSQTPIESRAPVRDVDCVITTRELLTLASSRGISLPSLPLQPLPSAFSPRFPDETLDAFLFSKQSLSKQAMTTGTSGGYLHHVLLTFQAKNPGSEIVTQRGRNADVVEYILMSPSGEPLMKAARYYGFRNIQNLVRKLKPARVSRLPGAKAPTAGAGNRRQPMSRNGAASAAGGDYAYVEVMACPGGCTNGGGQIRIEDAREINSPTTQIEGSEEARSISTKPTPHEQRSWLARVDEAYYSADSDAESEAETQTPITVSENETRVHEALRYWSGLTEIPLAKLVYTTYREVESDVGKPEQAANDTTRVVELAGKIGGGW